MKLRSQADAIMVGARTAEIDQPSLTVRDASGRPADRQPVRVVLARNTVPDAELFTDGQGRAVALIAQDWITDDIDGVELMGYDGQAGVSGALETLGAMGITHLLVEAGGGLMTALWETDLLDELVIVHAGGMVGPSGSDVFYRSEPQDGSVLARRMKVVETGALDGDAVTVWRRAEDKRT